MANARISDEEFIKVFNKLGSPNLISKETGLCISGIMQKMVRLQLKTWNDTSSRRVVKVTHEGRINYQIKTGKIIIFSDCHYLPDTRTTMHRALLAMIKHIKPEMIICNGDAFDGGTVSRWPRIGWDNKPSVKQELDCCQLYLGEVEDVAKSVGCNTLIWNLGNHDARFETKLAATASEYEGVNGFHLKDHFPKWMPSWVTWINEETIVTHNYHSGIHATHNNMLKGQVNYMTGHTHSLQVRPWTNARGDTLWAMDTGSIADSLGLHNVDYQQGRHGNHRSGFGLLSYVDGKLLMPEICMKFDEDSFEFRGHILDADSGEVIR